MPEAIPSGLFGQSWFDNAKSHHRPSTVIANRRFRHDDGSSGSQNGGRARHGRGCTAGGHAGLAAWRRVARSSNDHQPGPCHNVGLQFADRRAAQSLARPSLRRALPTAGRRCRFPRKAAATALPSPGLTAGRGSRHGVSAFQACRNGARDAALRGRI